MSDKIIHLFKYALYILCRSNFLLFCINYLGYLNNTLSFFVTFPNYYYFVYYSYDFNLFYSILDI